MLRDHDLTGANLPARTLCLTFDDGPGKDSEAIGDFLADQAISATFFGIGRAARERPEVVAHLRARGHLIGNHTDTHPTLVSFHRDGGDVVGEIARAEAAIGSPDPTGSPTYFRPPYGYWRDEGATTSPVARALNASGRFPHLVGPVGWDIDARDWHFWQTGQPAEACGQAYLAAIAAAGRGIVLLHDSGETPELRAGNRSLELVRFLVPRLQADGYRFVRLDAVPGLGNVR